MCVCFIIAQNDGQISEAIRVYKQALKVAGDNPNPRTYNNLAVLLTDTNRFKESIAAYEAALSIDGKLWDAIIGYVHVLNHVCKWDVVAKHYDLLKQLVGRYVVAPLHALSYPPFGPKVLLHAAQFKSSKTQDQVRGLVH